MNRNGDRGSKVSKGLFVCLFVGVCLFFSGVSVQSETPSRSLAFLSFAYTLFQCSARHKKKNAPEFTLAPTLLLKC